LQRVPETPRRIHGPPVHECACSWNVFWAKNAKCSVQFRTFRGRRVDGVPARRERVAGFLCRRLRRVQGRDRTRSAFAPRSTTRRPRPSAADCRSPTAQATQADHVRTRAHASGWHIRPARRRCAHRQLLFICRPENASSAACTYPAKSGKVHRPARAKIDLPRPRTGALIGLAIFPNQLAFLEAG
jgi:hypothetical protein